MLTVYAGSRFYEQIKLVAFIVLYLIIFQIFILGVPLANAVGTGLGITFVIVGLTFFLEGLILGLMPMGDRVGVKLPVKSGIVVISIFGLILGFGATFAEPAISALRAAGSTITAWDSPLLFLLLDIYTNWLVISVGIGVGIAVSLGMCRFYYNWPIKPFIFIIVPVVLFLSIWASFDENLIKIIGLAWDCGAVTTGAVTVPLVLALGIGVSKASNNSEGASGGFGIILLASIFPILAVLILGMILNTHVPKATTEKEFFATGNRETSRVFFNSDEDLLFHAFTRGSEEGRKSFYGNDADYENAIKQMQSNEELRAKQIGELSLADWIISRASPYERNLLSQVDISAINRTNNSGIGNTVYEEAKVGLQAVIPLSLFLLLVLIVFLKERIRYKDEMILGIVLTLTGMIMLTSGIRLGLASLGSEVGSQLPKAFASEEKFIDRVVINDFDSSLLYHSVLHDGTKKVFFNLYENNSWRPVAFQDEHFNHETGQYVHIITEKPMFSKDLIYVGMILVLIFSFGMGYGATMAEPALSALGLTVENLTIGEIKRLKIIQVVSIGVGLGITMGVARILFDIPLIWLIAPTYTLLLVLTMFSEDDFSAIAWDSGGVTTGPVTVPLVLAMGLSIGQVLHISDGFGVLALASALPVATVLLYGLFVKSKERKVLKESNDE